MINKISLSPNFNSQVRQTSLMSSPYANNVLSFTGKKTENPEVEKNAANVKYILSRVKTGEAGEIKANELAEAYRALNGLVRTSNTMSLFEAFTRMNEEMMTCDDPAHGIKGEKVGSRVRISDLVNEFVNKYRNNLPQKRDAIKSDVVISQDDESITDARTQLKSLGKDVFYEMAVRQKRPQGTDPDPMKNDELKQLIGIKVTPDVKLPDSKKMAESAYILNTKGNVMAVVEDNETRNNRYVLMTDTGKISKIDNSSGTMDVNAQKGHNVFHPFDVAPQEVRERHPEASVGKGTEIVIGMENGRFVPEIIKSIEDFEQKVNNGEIVLDTFHAAPDADKTQLAMLAGGFGSRAEYTNASSDGIFHHKENGAQSTKGVFRTATGLTPMETTFVTLHNAGLLDCSKGVLGIGKNIKFYLNQSGVNKGNGGFTIDMYDKMAREGRDNLLIFPNDPLSRTTNAVKEVNDIMRSGKAAMVMIAKEVDPEDAKSFGVMKLGEDNEIKAFVEKPKKVDDSLIHNGKCLANTFQFSVSKEAFSALELLGKYFPAGKGKEPRDWSKCLTPVLMSLTQNDDVNVMQEQIAKIVSAQPQDIPIEAIQEAKDILGDQKILAVPTDEPWADCGTLNALYHTTMQIASGDFQLEDFERANVLKSVNTHTGLVATTPELKEAVEGKYVIDGEVMVAPQAKKVNKSILNKYASAITINPKAV